MNRQTSPIIVKCPTCQKSVEWSPASPFRPFCSKRCQLIDLGEWAAESHRIPEDAAATEQEYWSEDEQLGLLPSHRDNQQGED